MGFILVCFSVKISFNFNFLTVKQSRDLVDILLCYFWLVSSFFICDFVQIIKRTVHVVRLHFMILVSWIVNWMLDLTLALVFNSCYRICYPCKEKWVKLTHVPLITDMKLVTRVVNHGSKHSARFHIALVTNCKKSECFLQLFDKFYSWLNFLCLGIIFSFKIFNIFKLEDFFYKAWKTVIDLKQRVEIACVANVT